MASYPNSIFRFRQDLRIHDNHGLSEALSQSKNILPLFIFDTDILAHFPKWDTRLGFLIDAVKELDRQLKAVWSQLYIYHGKPSEIIPQLIKQHDIQAVFANKSYGFGAVSRDKQLQQRCYDNQISFRLIKDFLLVEPSELPERKVFTPFSKLRYAYLEKNPPEIKASPKHIPTVHISDYHGFQYVVNNIDAGESSWKVDGYKTKLSEFDFAQYDNTRNAPGINGTSKLSPYIRFGLISIRELYKKLKDNPIYGEAAQTYCNELVRREFWQHIAHYHPQVRVQEFQEKRRWIKRQNDKILFQKWCDGQTWYPIVDAAMRQLKQENRMHGRARMIVASFLTKDLLIDRRRWEQHFANYLLDYDTNVNIGNRQWSASVWADPKPLRIFNPILQSQRFDPQAKYILKYIPELAGQELVAIHDPLTYHLDYYPPIVDHYVNSKLAKELYYWANRS